MFARSFCSTIIVIGASFAILTNTPLRAQEAWMVVSHEVENYDRWKEVFDSALPTRRTVGEIDFHIQYNLTNKNLVTVWFTWDTIERARAWSSDPALANGMAAAGVISKPTFFFGAIEATD